MGMSEKSTWQEGKNELVAEDRVELLLESQLHGEQTLAPRSGRFGVQAAGDEISLAATI